MFKFTLRLLSIFVLVSMLAAFPTSSAQAFGKIIRVSATPPIGPIGPIIRRCGGSWDTACGLTQALSIATLGDAIWVAEGTYKPTTTSDRTISFVLKNGVALYGGFAGTETALEQRDPFNHVTILSGDIGSTLSIYDNSYHVVITSGTDSTTILDGVTITGGQSNGLAASNYDKGAGLLNISGSPTLKNITISGNNVGTNGYGDGAGMYSTGDPTITNTVFSGNRTSSYGHGGGMYSNGNPLIMDVTFSNNWACGGGGLYSEGDPIVTNVTFSGNSAANGAGMYNYGGATFTNVTFSGNTAMYSGGGLETGSAWDLSYPTLTNVTFNGNSVTSTTSGKGGAIDGYNNHMIIHNSILWGNTAVNGPEIYQQGNQNTNIIYSVVAGGCPAGGICAHIYTSDPRLGLLGNYGGFTQTLPLLPGSSAIDNALNASCPFTDQRGVDRPQGKRCDVGAYEVLGPVEPGIYDDTHPAWVYAGTWTAAQGTGTYNNTLHQTRARGSYAEVTFYGAQVQLMYMTGPDRGLIEVTIDDGKYVDTIDANTLMSSQATWTSPVWDEGAHTVRFQIASRAWIDMDAIQVFLFVPPGGTTLISPNGSIADANPTYTWNKVTSSSQYQLSVSGSSGYAFTQWYESSVVCGANTCSVSGATPNLTGNTYTWKIQTRNDAGDGPWSANMSFTVIPLGPANLISPSGSSGTNLPTYTWQDVNGSTWYELFVSGPSGTVIDQWYTSADSHCDGNTCWITPTTTLANGTYTWWIRTYNSAGNGAWSTDMNFTVP